MTEVVPIDAIKKKVAERVKETEAAQKKKDGGGSKAEIDSQFIMNCLRQNELGDGELFKKLFRNDFVFNKSMDAWMRWVDHHWAVDKMDRALASVEKVAKVYSDEAKLIAKLISDTDDDDKVSYLKFKKESLNKRVSALRSTRRRKNCLTFAHTTENPLAIEGDEIDQKPWLLPCKNGVINLRTGDLEPGKQTDYLMAASPTEWPIDGIHSKCPAWDQFLNEVLVENSEMVSFLQRLLGLSLVGEVIHGIFIVMSGRGRNGKGTIIKTVGKIMGGLAGSIRSEMLLDQGRIQSSAGPTPDIMALRGKRMTFASETDENCKVSTARVKWLTGDDELAGRNPNDKYEVNFDPTHTLFLMTNNDPHAPADDYAFWERMIKIPFNLSFVNRKPVKDFEREADGELKTKLYKECPQILAWMVRGCLEFQRVGLSRPLEVVDAVKEYKQNEDIIGDYIEDRCIVGDDYKVGATAAYEDFKEWWLENVNKRGTPSKKKFGAWFGKRFKKVKSGTYTYFGVGLISDMDDVDRPDEMFKE